MYIREITTCTVRNNEIMSQHPQNMDIFRSLPMKTQFLEQEITYFYSSKMKQTFKKRVSYTEWYTQAYYIFI